MVKSYDGRHRDFSDSHTTQGCMIDAFQRHAEQRPLGLVQAYLRHFDFEILRMIRL